MMSPPRPDPSPKLESPPLRLTSEVNAANKSTTYAMAATMPATTSATLTPRSSSSAVSSMRWANFEVALNFSLRPCDSPALERLCWQDDDVAPSAGPTTEVAGPMTEVEVVTVVNHGESERRYQGRRACDHHYGSGKEHHADGAFQQLTRFRQPLRDIRDGAPLTTHVTPPFARVEPSPAPAPPIEPHRRAAEHS